MKVFMEQDKPVTAMPTIDEAVSVETIGYEGAHGKKPKGRGNWMFGISKNPDLGAKNKDVQYFEAGNLDYREAVKKAKSWAKKIDAFTIYTLS